MKGLYKLAVAFEKASQGIPTADQIRNISEKGPFGGAIPSHAPGAAPAAPAMDFNARANMKRDPDVFRIQTCLMNLGYSLPHGNDGIMGDETQTAINAFKKKYNLQKADPATVNARIQAEADAVAFGGGGKKQDQVALNFKSPGSPDAASNPAGPASADIKPLIDTSKYVNPNSGNFTGLK